MNARYSTTPTEPPRTSWFGIDWQAIAAICLIAPRYLAPIVRAGRRES